MTEHTADLRREEIARQNAIDVLRQLVAATFESDERLVDGAVRHNPDWRPFPQRAEVEAAIGTLLRSQDTATARIAIYDEALAAFFEDVDADWTNDNLRPGTFAFRFRAAADRLREAVDRGRCAGCGNETHYERDHGEDGCEAICTAPTNPGVQCTCQTYHPFRAVLSGETRTDGESQTVFAFPDGTTGPGDWDPKTQQVIPARSPTTPAATEETPE